MKGKIIADWSRVNVNDPANRLLVFGALQHYMDQVRAPEVTAALQAFNRLGPVASVAALQHLGVSGNFPTTPLEVIEKYGLELNFDEGWRELFDVRDYTGSTAKGFEIGTVSHGLTFKKVPVGNKAEIYEMSGEKAQVLFDMYGGGLGWHRTLFDDRDWWTLEDNARAFRSRAAYDRANIYYALIEAAGALGGNAVTWQAVTGSVPNTDANYVAIRDMNTINEACRSILVALKDAGYGISVNTPFRVVAHINLMPRINRALGLLNAGLAGDTFRGVQYGVSPLYSLMLTQTSYYYVVLPKIQMKAGIRMNPTIFSKFDETSYSDIAVQWERHGGAIGDTRQIRRCAVS